jgi:hypothetical protein
MQRERRIIRRRMMIAFQMLPNKNSLKPCKLINNLRTKICAESASVKLILMTIHLLAPANVLALLSSSILNVFVLGCQGRRM